MLYDARGSIFVGFSYGSVLSYHCFSAITAFQMPLPTAAIAMRRLFFLPFLALILFTGCDSGSSGPPSLDGDYALETQLGGAAYTFEITLSESNQSLSGGGTLTIEDQDSPQAATLELDVDGSHDHPGARIEMVAVDTETNDLTTLDGEASDDAERISGTLTFPSGTQQQVTMRRE